MTQAAAVPTKALEALKRYVKSIPYASNDNPVCELRDIQTLMKAERHIEALERLTRLFDSNLLPESGEVTSALADAEDLQGQLDEEKASARQLFEQVESLEEQVTELEDKVDTLTGELEGARSTIEELRAESDALRAQIPGFGGKA